MDRGEAARVIANSLQKLNLNLNSNPNPTSSVFDSFPSTRFGLTKKEPPSLVSLCLGVIGMHLEDIIADLGEIAINFPADIKMAMVAIARRRKLLNDDIIISLAESSWEILDISDSDISDFGLAKVAEICKSLRAVDLSRCSKVTSLGVSELVQQCHSLETLRCGGCPRSDHTARRCLDILKPKLNDVDGESWEELDTTEIAHGAESLRWLIWPNIDYDSLETLVTECPSIIPNPKPSHLGFRGLEVPREALPNITMDDLVLKDIDPQAWAVTGFTPRVDSASASSPNELHVAASSPNELHIAEKFRLAFVERDARLAPKRAKNARQRQRRAEKEWMTTSTTAKAILLASQVSKSVHRRNQ